MRLPRCQNDETYGGAVAGGIGGWPHLVNALDIEAWSRRLDSRGQFPGVVRMLINRNNDQITRLDMRDAEGTGAHGYDGIVEALRVSTLVPVGRSVWEMGVNEDANAKANKDYNERTKNPLGENQADTTFVFVTPQRWDGKDDWAKKREQTGPWKAVRVLDVSNLMQGLEEARAVHVRFSEMLGKPATSVQSIEYWWERFSTVTSPPISLQIALAGRADSAAQLLELLEEDRSFTTIRARSVDDVLGFVAATMLTTPEELRTGLLARTLIVHDAAALRQLDSSETLLILMPFDEQMRREAELVRSNHVLFMCEQDLPADIELPDIGIAAVTTQLTDDGIERTLAEELGRAAGTSLRRFQRVARAAQRPSPQPEWRTALADRDVRRAWLLRSWTTARSGDMEAFQSLVGKKFEEVEDALQQAARGADPIFSNVGSVWSVVSPSDYWDHVKPQLTGADLERLERIVQDVLGVVDPALDLPVEERWLAAIRGKSRVHSRELRRGLATTLALIGTKGEKSSLNSGLIGGPWVSQVLFALFTRVNADESGQLWASLTDVLPLLAEAAPDVFLRALDIAIAHPEILISQMFTDNRDDSFTTASPHTGLLWALEVTAWLPEHYGQSINALAGLAQIDPGGRLSNRPFGTLKDILRPWLPQTLVGFEERMGGLRTLVRRFPATGAKLLIALLPEEHDLATPNAKPKFRVEVPELRRADRREYVEAATMLVTELVPLLRDQAQLWPDFIPHLPDLLPADRERVYAELPGVIEPMAREQRTALWGAAQDLIRRHREFIDTWWALPEDELGRLETAITAAEPPDPRDTWRWLFDDTHPDIGIGKVADEYEATVGQLRVKALKQIIDAYGMTGLEQYVVTIKYPRLMGRVLADAAGVDRSAVIGHLDDEDGHLSEFAMGYADQMAQRNLQFPFEHLNRFEGRQLAQARLLQVVADLPAAWAKAKELGQEVDQAYWAEFTIWGRGNFTLVDEASRGLLDHGQPAAALDLMQLYMHGGRHRPNPDYVMEGLSSLGSGDGDLGRLSSYELETLIEYLRQSDADEDAVAMLEWKALPALGFEPRGLFLERKLARDPEFFVQILSLCFRSNNTDEASNVPQDVATNAYQLLRSWQTIPGTAGRGEPVDADALAAWYATAELLLIEVGRLDIGQEVIGQVLAHAPADEDGLWPCEPVRSFVEQVASERLEAGLRVECFNKRGVTRRSLDEGGAQEYALADQYAGWAARTATTAPRIAAVFRSLAKGYRLDGQREDDEAGRWLHGFDN